MVESIVSFLLIFPLNLMNFLLGVHGQKDVVIAFIYAESRRINLFVPDYIQQIVLEHTVSRTLAAQKENDWARKFQNRQW